MALRRLHALAAWLFVGAIVIQVLLVGLAIRELGGSRSFADHVNFGYAMGVLALALVVTAVIARAGRDAIAGSLGLLVLYVVQTLLPAFTGSMPWISALHPVNALALFAIAVWYARRAWRAPSVAA